MKKFRLIVTVDDSYYIKYLPLCVQAHRVFCNCDVAVLGLSNNTEEFVHCWHKYFDQAFIIRRVSGYHQIAQCKMGLIWAAGQFGSELVFLQGLDRIPLQREYMDWLTEQHTPNTILVPGKEYYDRDRYDKGKIPSGYIMGESCLFKQLVNPKDLDYYQFLEEWKGTHVFDDKEDPLGSGANFSDESLLRVMLDKIGPQWIEEHIRPIPRIFSPGEDTLDRAAWSLNEVRLHAGGYVEAHLPRPDDKGVAMTQPLMEYVGV